MRFLRGWKRRGARNAVLGEELDDDDTSVERLRIDAASVERRPAKLG